MMNDAPTVRPDAPSTLPPVKVTHGSGQYRWLGHHAEVARLKALAVELADEIARR